METPRLSDTLRELLLAAPPDVLAAYLYGSRARGEATPRSDLDLALLLAAPPAATLRSVRLDGEAFLQGLDGPRRVPLQVGHVGPVLVDEGEARGEAGRLIQQPHGPGVVAATGQPARLVGQADGAPLLRRAGLLGERVGAQAQEGLPRGQVVGAVAEGGASSASATARSSPWSCSAYGGVVPPSRAVGRSDSRAA